MPGHRSEEAWSGWRSIPRLAVRLASVPVVVGCASVGAALLLGRSVGEVLRTASRALEEVAANAKQTGAIATWLRSTPRTTSRNGGARPGAKPQRDALEAPAGAELEGRDGASRREGGADGARSGPTRVEPALADASQWIVWPHSVSAVARAGMALRLGLSRARTPRSATVATR